MPPKLERQTNELVNSPDEAYVEHILSRLLVDLGERWTVERAEQHCIWLHVHSKKRIHIQVASDVPYIVCTTAMICQETQYGWFCADDSSPFAGTPAEVLFYCEQVMRKK